MVHLSHSVIKSCASGSNKKQSQFVKDNKKRKKRNKGAKYAEKQRNVNEMGDESELDCWIGEIRGRRVRKENKSFH